MQMRWKIFRLFVLIAIVTLLVLQDVSCSARLQPTTNKYGLQVVQKAATLLPAILADSPNAMVPLSQYLQPLQTDFAYATSSNFTHQVLYKNSGAYLRKEAALALQKVQDTLQSIGLDIKIWDTYRPYSVTEKMWAIVPDDRYAANPATGSGHNRGIAVDLTLTDSTGKEMLMPTGFDNFTDSAHHSFTKLSAEAIRNRKLLKAVMEQYGFIALPTEWWHYSLPNPKRYELLNISFGEMKTITALNKLNKYGK